MPSKPRQTSVDPTPGLRRFPRGSEWRKWDLHIHPPGTKLSDGYGSPADVDRFCHALEASDVEAFGITDYFSADAFLAVSERYHALYPDSSKVLFPNIELRLNETVNGANQIVDLHLLLRPDVDWATIRRLLAELKTTITAASGRHLRCSDLATDTHFESASVTRSDVEDAIAQTFGKKLVRTENVLIIVPSNNNGIRAGGGLHRKENLADEIDKLADAIYGNSRNTDWFLREDRFADQEQRSVPKPVFACSDAHSFEQLDEWLGRHVENTGTLREVTWIKADLTFEGLQQTLVEPKDRVRIQTSKPDAKEPYKVISSVSFRGGGFPSRIVFNSNLVSIIGSRSSGKSALIAYVAHAIDPDYTVEQQVASGLMEEGKAGPAAAKTWAEVADIECTVEWGDPSVTDGKVIYIPQNSLFAVSERPEEITEKIQPALYRVDPDLGAAHQRMTAETAASRIVISSAVNEWFSLAGQAKDARADLRDLGDQAAIISTRDALAARVAELRAASSLSAEDVAAYQRVVDQLAINAARRTAVQEEIATIVPFVMQVGDTFEAVGVTLEVQSTPAISTFPTALATEINAIIERAMDPLAAAVHAAVIDFLVQHRADLVALDDADAALAQDNADLIQRNQANDELEAVVNSHKRQEEILRRIDAKLQSIENIVGQQVTQTEAVVAERARLLGHVEAFKTQFESVPRQLDEMTFGIEHQITDDAVQSMSSGFNRQENTIYFDRSVSELIELERVFANPAAFLSDLENGKQKVKRGVDVRQLAVQVLTATPEVRFIATLEGDRIGGFARSSMTPGKQALFALSLILNESAESWPLLIDQPEDDLDSRSIFDTIVPYLVARKADRQILMVSHDANLVVGADSEQVIIANRHGVDRKNRDGSTFAYLTGSLEHSQPERKAEFVLETCGIREHACRILDGGETAFQKRRDKYKL